MATEEVVKLVCFDNVEADVPMGVAKMSMTIKNSLEELGDRAKVVRLPQVVSGKILVKVLEYCNWHHDNPSADVGNGLDDFLPWDKKFITAVDNETLFELILAANRLAIKPLEDLSCRALALMIRGKSPEEIRKIFNILEPTAEEIEEIRKANPWLEEEDEK